MHGCGVKTPKAAVVAAATCGLARLLHMPNDIMFAMGIWSMIFAAGTDSPLTRLTGVTIKLLGATPMLHVSIAPMTTCCGIVQEMCRHIEKYGKEIKLLNILKNLVKFIKRE